jgi:large subunit ribosomal protein L30
MAKNIKLKVTFVKSTIGGTRVQRETIRSLGFRKLHQSRIVEDTPMFRGMINRVIHLLKVEEVSS